MITSSSSTSAMAPRFHQRERRDCTMAMSESLKQRFSAPSID
jgi:hypothetical protein